MHVGQKLDKYDTIRYGRLLDTPCRRGDRHRYYSSSSSNKHDDQHYYHPYRRRDRKYFSNEFKKSNPPTLDGEMKKSQDTKAWLSGMRKFFMLHDYLENMKARITTFSLKGKANIWWQDVKNARGMHEEDFTWNEFEQLFKNMCLSERYFDDREN